MVYCGKPSKGCAQCRSRKIRCDQARPTCTQCRRTKRECPGYRDELSLMFRDESQLTVRKAVAGPSASAASRQRQSRSGLSCTGSPEQKRAGDASAGSTRAVQQREPSPLWIEPTTGFSRNEAISFFLQSHAIPGSFLMTDSSPKFLTDPGASLNQRAMQAAVIAVGSAMLSRVRGVPSLRQLARREYGVALQLVNKVLADSEEAKTNMAMGVVVLLALYELVVSRAPQGMDGWINHIIGAAALLEHRGDKGSPAGLSLFLHLRYQIVISCLQRDVWVPDSLMQRTKLEMFLDPKDTAGVKLIMIIAHLSNLRADVQAKLLTNPEEILKRAVDREENLITWSNSLPPGFLCTTRTTTSPNIAFARHCRGVPPYNNEYHVYASLLAASTWNHYRCARILVDELIISHYNKLSPTSPTPYLSDGFHSYIVSLRMEISQFGADICRSVPFHLGACNSEITPGMAKLPHESYLSGLMLLWPLFMAGVVEGPTHPMRRWVMHCLNMIGHTMGLDQALATMDILSLDPGMFSSAAIYGEVADPPSGLPGLLSISVFHVPAYELPQRREYQEIRASSE
ncbi:hypothetical protein N7492_008608 [Penicillium capsulatum]|uniref:Zn(2)-C6 fungal-type domain-containing protein n=1 Tax=Penicillium capsulatum TaxID=69766 RepID=A0A9W9HTE6_9EURO|nr:hypothetical protein N7492_008608 [Penicillium capsulatum]KAJ6106013.1 hypothetical protein N7512_009530 [Penicillium capsulatum]